MYLDFAEGSWLRAPKTFGISCDKADRGVFCYVNEITLDPILGQRPVARRTNFRIRGWKFLSHPLDPWGGGGPGS